jgi:hypothetical protein
MREPNGDCHRHGDSIVTGFVEAAVSQFVGKRQAPSSEIVGTLPCDEDSLDPATLCAEPLSKPLRSERLTSSGVAHGSSRVGHTMRRTV